MGQEDHECEAAGEGEEEEEEQEEAEIGEIQGAVENTFVFTCQYLKNTRKFLTFAGGFRMERAFGTGGTY